MTFRVKVEVQADVQIKLPRLTVSIDRDHAEQLRDALGEVLPEQITDLLHDPRVSDVDVLQAAQALLAERGQDTENLAVAIESIKLMQRRCVLCRCEATGEAFGFPVCDYHLDHSEDEPRCPHCAGKYTCERCENRNAEHVVRDVALCDRCAQVVQSVAIGDRVRDPLDGSWREIVGIDGLADGGTCHMADGGCMSLDECAAAEKRLPSEDLS